MCSCLPLVFCWGISQFCRHIWIRFPCSTAYGSLQACIARGVWCQHAFHPPAGARSDWNRKHLAEPVSESGLNPGLPCQYSPPWATGRKQPTPPGSCLSLSGSVCLSSLAPLSRPSLSHLSRLSLSLARIQIYICLTLLISYVAKI